MRSDDLTQQQERFVEEYKKDRNGKQAAIRAGYSDKCAAVAASKMLSKEKIASLVKVEVRQGNVEVTCDETTNAKTPETFDGETGKLDPLLRHPKLSSLKDVRLEMAYIYRRMENNVIETPDGSKLIFALRQIGDIITMSEFEERIQELEARHEAQRLEGRTSGHPELLPYRQ